MKNIIFPNGFLLNRMKKKVSSDLNPRGPLKIFTIKSGSYSGLGLSIYVKNRILNLAELSL